MVVLRDISLNRFANIIWPHHRPRARIPAERQGGRHQQAARVVDGYARRFQVQEKLTAQIAGASTKIAAGVGVVTMRFTNADDARRA